MLEARDLLSALPLPAARALDVLALWLVTYALHSTLLLGSAWLSGRLVPAAAERAWRFAFFGSLLTATLHSGGHLPRVTVIRLAGLPAVEAPAVPPSRIARGAESSLAERRPPAPSVVDTAGRGAATVSWPATSPPPDGATGMRDARAHRSAQWPAASGARLPVGSRSPASRSLEGASPSATTLQGAEGALLWRAVGLAWIVAFAATLLLLAIRTARFAWRHGDRETVRAGEAVRVLRELIRRAGFRPAVRLSVSPVARVPMAKGWVRPEICLPPGLDRRLATEELEAALAHELAHLERRDPVWRALGRTAASALAFQPLNRLACRVLEDEAELRCDDRAAALTGRPAALARCLTRVADWTAGSAPAALPALAANGSTLRRRVLRLLDDRPHRPAPWWTQLGALVPIAVVMALAPSLAAAPPEAAAAPPAAFDAADPGAEPSSLRTAAGKSYAGPATVADAPERPSSANGEASAARDALPVVHVLSLPIFSEVPPEPPVAPAPPAAAVHPPEAPQTPAIAPTPPTAPAHPLPVVPPAARAPRQPATPVAAPPRPPAPPVVAPHVHIAPPELAPPAPEADEPEEADEDAAEERAEEEQERAAEEQERAAEEQERAVEEQERAAEEQERAVEEQERAAEEQERAAEERERAAEEQEEAAEEAEERIEAAMAAAEGEIEEAIEIEMEAIEEAIEIQVESIEQGVELALAPLEAAIDALSDQLEEALAGDDRQRSEAIAAEMGELGAAMGELGGRIGEIVSESGLSSIDDEVHASLAQHAQELAELVQPQVELAQRLGREIDDRRRRGAPLEDDETRAMQAELDRLAAQTEARREELERAAETLGREMQPAQERLRTLEAELRTEIERWRRRNAALLERLGNGETPLDVGPVEDGSLR